MMQPMHGTLAHAAAPKRGKSAVLRSLEELSSEMQTEGAVLIMPEEEVFFSPTRTHFDHMSHTHSFYLSPALFSRRCFSLTHPFSPYVAPHFSHISPSFFLEFFSHSPILPICHTQFFLYASIFFLAQDVESLAAAADDIAAAEAAELELDDGSLEALLSRTPEPIGVSSPPRNPPYPPPPLPPRTPP